MIDVTAATAAHAASLTDAAGTRHHPVAARDARIVCLVPSLTELLCDLGLSAAVVGRTGFCIHPADKVASIPKVGGTKDLNIEKIRQLAPTHLIVNIDENEQPTVALLAQFIPHIVVTHPLLPRDNLALYRLFGELFEVMPAAQRLCAEFELAWARLPVAAPRQTVVYCIWQDPWMTVSAATYIAAMLALIAWECWTPSDDARRYPAFSWNSAMLEQIDLVCLSTEPYRFTAVHVDALEKQLGKPVLLIDGERLSWYGSRAIAGLDYLAQLCRGETE